METILSVNDTPGAFAPLLALLRGAVSNEPVATMLRGFVTTEILGRIAAFVVRDEPEIRAAWPDHRSSGLAMERYDVRIP